MPRIILFELNEVPYRVIDYYRKTRPESNLAQIYPRCIKFQTNAEDVTALSPWKTWPSFHRGIPDSRHEIFEFGQNLSQQDQEFPPVWEILRRQNIKIGVFGSLHSYESFPDQLSSVSFYMPDTFAAGPECFPQAMTSFQQFNLEMVAQSARNVSTGIAWKKALSMLGHWGSLGLRPATFAKIAGQIASEKLSENRKVRRRTLQTVLSFDVFMKQLKSTCPDFVTFFSNHVASTMHRYWGAAFPDDYQNVPESKEWLASFGEEILYVMDEFDLFLGHLGRFIRDHPNYELWLASSMGQSAVQYQLSETQLFLTSPELFMEKLGLKRDEWRKVPAMVPQYNFYFESSRKNQLKKNLESLCEGSPIEFYLSGDNYLSLTIGSEKGHGHKKPLTLAGQRFSPEELGLKRDLVEDPRGCTAYHIPQGHLLIYHPGNKPDFSIPREISALSVTPAILQNYGLSIPAYMSRPFVGLPVRASAAGH